MSRQSGSVALLCSAILLPLLLLFLMLCVGLSKYYREIDRTQQTLDEAVLRSYRFLPFRSEAERALRRYASDISRLSGELHIESSNDFIGVRYDGLSDLGFGGLLGGRAVLPYSVEARARGAVLNVSIVVDSGASMAPLSGAELRGSEHEWPAAELFLDPRFIESAGSAVDARFLTQQCFNPEFSALKHAALLFSDYLTAFPKNSVSVAFFPGTLGEADVVKDGVRGGNSADATPLAYFTVANSAYSSNSHCLAASEQESFHQPYRLPPSRIGGNGAVGTFVDLETLRFDESQIGRLSIRELLWTRAAAPRMPDIGAGLSVMRTQLAQGGAENSALTDNALRRAALNVGVFFLGELPHAGGRRFPDPLVREILAGRLRRFAPPAVVYFVILNREGAIDHAAADELDSFLSRAVPEGEAGIRTRVVVAEDPDGLVQGVIRSLSLENNTAVVDR